MNRKVSVDGYTDIPVKVGFANTGPAPIDVYWINYSQADSDYDDQPQPLMTVQPGQSAEIDAYQGFAFSIKNDRGQCIDEVQAWDPSNSFSFGDGSTPVGDTAGGEGCTPTGGNCRPDEDSPTADGGACSVDRQRLVSQYTDRPATVTIANTGPANLNVFWINYSYEDSDYNDASRPQSVVGPGQSVDIDAYQGFGFAIKDDSWQCLAIVEARESRNHFSFGDGSSPVNDNNPQVSDGDEQSQGLTDEQIANGCSGRSPGDRFQLHAKSRQCQDRQHRSGAAPRLLDQLFGRIFRLRQSTERTGCAGPRAGR